MHLRARVKRFRSSISNDKEKIMDGIFNNNFLLGMILAKDLPKEQKLLYGMTAGLFPKTNMMGPLLLKPQIDTRIDLETKRANLEKHLEAPLTIKIPAAAAAAGLSITLGAEYANSVNCEGDPTTSPPTPPRGIPAINGIPGATLTSAGILTIPAAAAANKSAFLRVIADGVKRSVIIRII
jgi:hypothetical protein